jgi:hypothetical protein
MSEFNFDGLGIEELLQVQKNGYHLKKQKKQLKRLEQSRRH